MAGTSAGGPSNTSYLKSLAAAQSITEAVRGMPVEDEFRKAHEGEEGPSSSQIALPARLSQLSPRIRGTEPPEAFPPTAPKALREIKNLEQYLGELKGKTVKKLKELRYERKLMHVKKINVIAELQREIQTLRDDNRYLQERMEHAGDRLSVSESRVMQQRLSALEQDKRSFERVLSQKDALIEQLERKLESQKQAAQSSAGKESPKVSSREIEKLQCLLQDKERELITGKREVSEIIAQIQDRDQELLFRQQEIDTLRNQLQSQIETSNNLQKEKAGKHTDEEVQKLQEENSRLIKDMAELKVQIAQMMGSMDKKGEEKKEEERAVRIDVKASATSGGLSAPREAARKLQSGGLGDPEIVEKLQSAYEEIAALYDIRDEILDELESIRKEMFNPQTMRKMVKIIRDRELAAFQKSTGQLQNELKASKADCRRVMEDLEALQETCNHKMKIVELESQGMIRHLTDKWRSEFERRKKLHNTLLELKGNLRVFCRVRPVSHTDEDRIAITAKDEETLHVSAKDGKNSFKDYEFDRVFGAQDGQALVFEEVSGLVTSVMDGYNVCIMAYGQTGSGKTYTMEGPEDDPGVNSRALAELFKISEQRKEQQIYTLRASVLEIYNEHIIDLLSDAKDQRLDIKQDVDGMYVPGLTLEPVSNMADVEALIQAGKKRRSTFATNMNERSSRSHFVLSVYVESTPVSATDSSLKPLRGKLHLIDLAGSERLSKTGAKGDRLKEAQNINKSLSALGDVIQALRQKSQHVPFRNSKLTRLLEDSLGRTSKCILMVNFNPLVENCAESRCSAEFASRAKKVELVRPSSNAQATVTVRRRVVQK